jgi:fused signal recognition particle receptor
LIGRIGRGFARLREGLTKSRTQLHDGVRAIVRGRAAVDEEMWEEIEELLLRSDVGAATAEDLVAELRRVAGRWSRPDPDQVLEALRETVARQLGDGADDEGALVVTAAEGPAVVLVVGVNGAGKTTTIAKLAARLKAEGRTVLLAAADTFRVAATEQLAEWAARADVPIVRGREGGDAAAVAYDALESALARGVDVLLVDTAGRLHTKSHLMEELRKIRRTLERRLPGAPHEVLLVLDATTGQNAVQQARSFGESLGVTGLVLAKLDGSARGGVVLAIRRELDVPVKLVGVGESLDDLQDFAPAAFAAALVAGEDAPDASGADGADGAAEPGGDR